MQNPSHDYLKCIQNSEKVSWKISDILPNEARLDFRLKFLPEGLVSSEDLATLDDRERLALNQIRANSYLYLFRFVEEFIITMTVQHANAAIFGDGITLRALLRFAEEEVKHRELFRQFAAVFADGFGSPCGTAGSSEDVTAMILKKSSMAVLLMTLHIELMTQHHFVESVANPGEGELEPLFKSLLRHHWLEEAQHARIDALELRSWAKYASQEARDRAVDEYLEILTAFDELLLQQVGADMEALEARIGRTLSDAERADFVRIQHRSYKRVFVLQGMTNPTFEEELRAFSPVGATRVAEFAKALIP